MSLRGRLAATIAFATVAILIVGGLLSHRHALEKISVEMDAAHRVALNAISRLIAELPASAHPQRDLDSLVRTFNGDRHVRLLLIDAFGQVRLESHLAPPRLPAPAAFEAVLAPSREGDVLALPGNAAPLVAVMLVVVPVNEIAEVWSDLLLNLSILGLFVALAFGLVFSVVGRSLMPLGALVSAFHRIGKGDYAVVLAPRGPPELAALARGCNEMAARLAEMAQRNRRLSEQLMRLQDEERAELARDLHDDVGPFLFAIDVDATSIAGILEGSEHEDPHKSAIGERAASIRQAARHARLEV
ncbi:MAG: HAMP domain-containing protein, partial [Rhizobiaceae bacterium]|nr:HAMP domain-containing protein [Rhizobiaceae bacterium]